MCESFSSPWSTVRRGPGAGRENCAPLNLMASSSSWRRSSASAILLSRSLAVSGFLALRSRSRASSRASMGFRATTSSSLDSSRGGLRMRGGYASRGRSIRRAPGERRGRHRRRGACLLCGGRRGDGTATARRHGAAQWLGSPNRYMRRPRQPETVCVGVSTARDGVCVYRLRCLMHFCRCFGAAGAALCAVVNGPPRGSATSGRFLGEA